MKHEEAIGRLKGDVEYYILCLKTINDVPEKLRNRYHTERIIILQDRIKSLKQSLKVLGEGRNE